MAHCKYCGKELDDDGKCTCEEFQKNENNKEYIVGTVEKTEKKKKKEKKRKKDEEKPIKRGSIFNYIALFIVLFAVIFIIIFIFSVVNAYKKPVEHLARGIRKADSETIIESIYTDNTAAEIRLKAKDNGLTWEEYLKQTDKSIESAIDGMGIKRLRAKVTAKERLSGSNFDDIESFYMTKYDTKIKKAYRVEVEFTYRQGGEKMTSTGWLCVAKVKGEGWKYCKDYDLDTFDFIDTALGQL